MKHSNHTIYHSFALVYDLFMDNIPYPEWSDYIRSLLTEYNITDGLILDLGCGTGTLTELLSKAGYDLIGIDSSSDMLDIAMEKKSISGLDILYIQQDMREFELYGTVRAVICICDAINYIMEYSDLVQVFRLVNNYLDPDGIFIFDINTKYKYETLLGDTTIAENREDSSFIWENDYNQEEQIHEYDLTLFIKEQNSLYQKYAETHYQRCYSLAEIKSAIQEAGLKWITSYDAFTHNPPTEQSERIYILAKENQKNY